DRGLQLLELLARAQQHRALHLELLAGDQVEPGQARLQHRLEVLLQLLPTLAQPRRDQAAEAASQVVDVVEVNHAAAPVLGMRPASSAPREDAVGGWRSRA